ncbi:amidohydrolase [Acidocella aquatica]|uniref:Amidohydrolase n=1 Tax=Acidocella aquatica TaxID=1922313 RepID=A0ABQ6A4U3_9PROT|nr:amidohydrolase family protein [Acidocella aquatica]GLR67189.1 amidohydrolase [Acidocella aquatica]
MATDIHTHIVPAGFPAYAGHSGEAAWPSICPAGCGHRHVMIGGGIFRTVPTCTSIAAERLADMDRHGIQRQALSPMPELLSYKFSADDARAMAAVVNNTIGAMVEVAPARFTGLGMVPLQDPALAATALRDLMRDGRFRGVEIGTNIAGVPIGDARFTPFFAAAENLGAAVFVHAFQPSGLDRLIGPPVLGAVAAFPTETALAISGLMTGGMLSRFPGLKIAFSHGGGAFASVLPRLQHGWQALKPLQTLMSESPVKIARRLYYDTLVYDGPTLRHLVDIFGATQLMIGTDYPFEIQEADPLGALAAACLPPETLTLLRTENARRFLGC